MKKGKGSIILLIAVTLIIVLSFDGAKLVKANKVNSLIQLGNQYIAEGNYKEAIIEFEKAININDKNIEVKETLDVLYVYEEIDELVQAGNFEDAHNKLEEIKDMPKFDIIKDTTEKIEKTINEELLANGMGNSIHNTISNGQIAYKGDVVFYRNNNDGGRLYKKDLNTGEELKLTDDFVTSLNVYRDYVYYLVPEDPEGATISTNTDKLKIKKVKNDGTENELVLGEGSWISSEQFQIIDGILYYESNAENHTPSEMIYNIVSLNLETKESKNILKLNKKLGGSWILNKNSEGKISIYSHEHEGSISFIEDINNINKSMIIDENVSSEIIKILGIDNNKMYYNLTMDMGNRNNPILRIKAFDHDNNKFTEIKKYENVITYLPRILGNKYYYYIKNNSLIGIDLNTGEEDEIKKINNIKGSLSRFEGDLFEVKGYLAYFDKNNELVIDKDILIKSIGIQDKNNEVNKQDEESNILSSLPSEDVYELNEILSFFRDRNSLMDGYDRENVNMENIAYTAFLYDPNIGEVETIGEDYYVSKGRTIIDTIAKKLFNIDIDIDMLSSDLHEAIYGEDFENRKGIAFKDDKYYTVLASGRFPSRFALADEIVKNDNTYTINFTMYTITDHNYYESREIFIETGAVQGCEVSGTGIAEVREDVVNGEKVYYFTKYNEIPN